MSKLQQILTYLESEKLDVAVVSDPVTINYLTGFYSDPHERQMFLFVLADQEPLLFVPALEVERATSTVSFPVVGYVDSENPWKKIQNALPQLDFKRVAVEFDNLILTKYHGLKTVFESADFENLTPLIQRMRLIKSADEVQKMMVAGVYADKSVKVGFDNISLDNTETDIIAQIDFAMKREGYEMSFDTMVLTGDNAANPHGIPGANKIENNALLLFDLGVMVNGYASDMTRTVAVGKPDQFKKDIYNLTLEAQQAALDFIKPGVTAHEVDRAAREVIEKLATVNTSITVSVMVSVWMSTNSLQSWKETTWLSKKACASQLSLVSTSLVKSGSASRTAVLLRRMASTSLQAPAKTCFILIKKYITKNKMEKLFFSILFFDLIINFIGYITFSFNCIWNRLPKSHTRLFHHTTRGGI